MKRLIPALVVVFCVSCNLPARESFETATPSFTPAATQTPPPVSTDTPTPLTLTPTPILCDPLTADYCITNGPFMFQRPIQPPDNDRIDPSYAYASTQNKKRDAHHGVEFLAEYGAPVHAAADGRVAFAEADAYVRLSPWTNFYGDVIVVRHAGETFTLYAHLSNILVKEGDDVRVGDVIGNVGQTGGATGPHLHFEVRKGGDFTAYFSTENPELWFIPKPGTGAISITLKTQSGENSERPLVVTRLADTNDDVLFTYYLKSYAKGFEHNSEDTVLTDLPPGRYKIAFNDAFGLEERIVVVEAGRLTEVVFEVK